MRMSAQVYWVRLYFLYYFRQLVLCATFSYFLCKIVAERVIHYLHESVNCMGKNDVVDLFFVFFYFLL